MIRDVLLIICGLCLSLSMFAKEVKITSPDGNYQMRVYDREGKIYYSVDYKNEPVILESLLGISSNEAGKAIESDAASDNKAVGDWVDRSENRRRRGNAGRQGLDSSVWRAKPVC
jgi:hypothetical protein